MMLLASLPLPLASQSPSPLLHRPWHQSSCVRCAARHLSFLLCALLLSLQLGPCADLRGWRDRAFPPFRQRRQRLRPFWPYPPTAWRQQHGPWRPQPLHRSLQSAALRMAASTRYGTAFNGSAPREGGDDGRKVESLKKCRQRRQEGSARTRAEDKAAQIWARIAYVYACVFARPCLASTAVERGCRGGRGEPEAGRERDG